MVMGSSVDPARGVFTIEQAALSPAEQRDWNVALDYYEQTLAGKDLLQNFDMVAINDVLASLGACTEISGTRDPQCASGLRKEMITALTLAAPVYRAHWWTEDDRANRVWIDQVSRLVGKWGVRVAQQLGLGLSNSVATRTARGRRGWVRRPLGAYTTPDPLHLTVSSRDPRNLGGGGLAAFEVLFYEASHGVATSLERAIAVGCREAGSRFRAICGTLRCCTPRRRLCNGKSAARLAKEFLRLIRCTSLTISNMRCLLEDGRTISPRYRCIGSRISMDAWVS